MKAYTDLEQSKKLAEILPIESADLIYIMYRNGEKPQNGDANLPRVYESNEHNWYWVDIIDGSWDMRIEKDIPCWSLSALLDLMPERISINNEASYPLTLKKCVWGYSFTYGSYKRIIDDVTTIGLTPIEAAYSMVVWLLENNYI